MARQSVDLIPFDFEHYVESLARYLRVNLPNDYQDFLESNAARVLIDAIAYEMGLLAYMVNANLKQMFLPTATTRRAMYLLGKLVNYDLQGSIPSQATLTFYLDEVHGADIPIPKGTQVQAPNTTPVIFETVADAVLQAGNLSVDVLAKQGVTVEEIIGTTASQAVANQTFLSTRPPLLDTISLLISDIEWRLVDNIFDLDEGELGYTAKPNEDGLAIITFGNGLFGAIPPSNEDITLVYRVGGGTTTNVGTGAITEVVHNLLDANAQIVSVSVTNTAAAAGGRDRESIDEARVNIPRHVRSMDRFVSQEDFQKVPELFKDPNIGEVFKSNAVVKYTWAEHIITIYVLGEPLEGRFQPPTIPTQAVLDAVREYIEERTLPTIAISVEPAVLYPVKVTGQVFYLSNYR